MESSDILSPDVKQTVRDDDGGTLQPAIPHMARHFERYRAITANGTLEPVQILLIHVARGEFTSLHFPDYLK